MSDLHRPKKIHRTLVWGGWYGSRNIGDTAILLGIRELYKKINSDKHYYLGFLSTDVDYTSTNGVTGKRALLKSDVVKPWNWIKLVNNFKESDRVIISGGTPIFDFSHKIRSAYFFLPLMFKKPFILFGAGVKPIKSKYGRWYIPFTLKKADYISARDDGSTEILKGLGLEKTVKTADSAFFAPASTREDLEVVLQRYGIKWDDKLLVVAPRLMSSDQKRLYLDEHMDENIIEETPKKMAAAIDKVAGKFDKVVFMAMHYYGPDSDVELIKETIRHTKSKKVVFIEEELRAETGIALFKHASVVLAMRLHALLLSASMATPVVGIAYETKVKHLFRRLEIEDYVVDLFDFSKDELVNVLEKAVANREVVHKHLEKRVAELRKLVLKDAQSVLKISDEYSDK
jgi:N-acetylglucosaminyldiphosphoundecaprenol N-acetyl-beta-D-mannosaminyltransferase